MSVSLRQKKDVGEILTGIDMQNRFELIDPVHSSSRKRYQHTYSNKTIYTYSKKNFKSFLSNYYDAMLLIAVISRPRLNYSCFSRRLSSK